MIIIMKSTSKTVPDVVLGHCKCVTSRGRWKQIIEDFWKAAEIQSRRSIMPFGSGWNYGTRADLIIWRRVQPSHKSWSLHLSPWLVYASQFSHFFFFFLRETPLQLSGWLPLSGSLVTPPHGVTLTPDWWRLSMHESSLFHQTHISLTEFVTKTDSCITS